MTISVVSNDTFIGKGGTVNFTAVASGIGGGFRYQWRKRGFNKLPDKVLGKDMLVLTIPEIDKSDEGQYYCVATNRWNRSVESNNVTLNIYGMSVYLILHVQVHA